MAEKKIKFLGDCANECFFFSFLLPTATNARHLEPIINDFLKQLGIKDDKNITCLQKNNRCPVSNNL